MPCSAAFDERSYARRLAAALNTAADRVEVDVLRCDEGSRRQLQTSSNSSGTTGLLVRVLAEGSSELRALANSLEQLRVNGDAFEEAVGSPVAFTSPPELVVVSEKYRAGTTASAEEGWGCCFWPRRSWG